MALSTALQINFDSIPEELKALPQWVCWRLEERDGKDTKVPYNAASGKPARSNSPETWNGFERVRAAFQTGQYTGVGFVLSESNGIVGGDLDNCVTEGAVDSWAEEIVNKVSTYTELTPSGNGLRFFARGNLPGRGRKKGNVELYTTHRFLTITGHAIGTPHIEDRTEEILAIHNEYFTQEEIPTVNNQTEELRRLPLPDDSILTLAFSNSANGLAIRELYSGNWQGAYSSQSEADSALCHHLAFWAGRDAGKIDRLFRNSGLFREKWDKPHYAGGETYGQRTVAQAAERVTESYTPTTGTLRGRRARQWIVDGVETEITSSEEEEGSETEKAADRGIYAQRKGRTMLRITKQKQSAEGEKEDSDLRLIADHVACIAGEVRDEDGLALYEIEGRTSRGKHFQIELVAGKMSDPKYVSGQFANATGAGSIIYAGMEKHLAPAVHSFTDEKTVKHSRRFNRTGWTRDGTEFIIPGMEAEDVVIHLEDLPYHIDPEADLQKGLETLGNLLRAQKSEATTVCLSHMLTGPLAFPANWRDDKYGLFIAGRTGSFKSSWAIVAMCLYGPEFRKEEKLIKFGHGGTLNAVTDIMVKASDVPLLIDNYKPSTGRGEEELRNLIHSALEGGEKRRMNRDLQLRKSRPIHCWPVFTGEDVPDKDAASLARVLVVNFDWLGDENNPLTAVQDDPFNLCAVGGAWIRWIVSDEGKKVTKNLSSLLSGRRAVWTRTLRELRSDMVNVNRVATNLALNQLAWEIAEAHPDIGPIIKPFTAAHEKGLQTVAGTMSRYTCEAFEANRMIEALREMLASGTAMLLPKSKEFTGDSSKCLHLGWWDSKGEYILPKTSYEAASNFLRNSGGLSGVSEVTVKKQLVQLGYVARVDPDGKHMEIKASCGGKKLRVLHLKPGTLESLEKADDDDD